MEDGIYIYGIIKTADTEDFGPIGISEGVAPVLTMGYNGLAAVISRTPCVAYDSLSREQTIKDLVIHQSVIEKVMERFTIVPVKFGTMVRSEEEALDFLRKGHALLLQELDKMADKIELDVVASWDLSKILPTIYRRDSRLQDLQEQIALKGTGVAVEEKIALGKLTAQALQEHKAAYQGLIMQTLTAEAVSMCVHELAGEEMMCNAGFLLEKGNVETFHQQLALLDQKLEQMVNFRVVGPLPLYSFSTILLEKIDPGKLEEAKSLFGLRDEITAKKVQEVYHCLAQKCHPDKNGREDGLNFHLVNSAYQTLKNFSENGPLRVEVYRWEKEVG